MDVVLEDVVLEDVVLEVKAGSKSGTDKKFDSEDSTTTDPALSEQVILRSSQSDSAVLLKTI